MTRYGMEGVLALALALCAATAAAQEVTGTVRDETQKPLAGAVVILASPSGSRVSATLTDDAGRFRLQAPSSGSFTLRVDVIGYRSVHVPAFQVDAGATVTRDVLFRFERTKLPAVAVTATSSCARVAGDAGDAPNLWAEARKTLEAASLAIEEKRFNVALRRFERTIGLPDSVLRDSRTWTQSGVTANPFETLTAGTVARDGFSIRRDTSRFYYAPDAAILLSDAFVNGHCFGTRRGGPAGSVGLTFRPQQVSSRVDIDGVLWLDSATAELRTVEYRYVTSSRRQDAGGGGYVSFGRYPSGLWGVQRWAIRFPVLHVNESRRRPDGAVGAFVDTVMVALQEVGGEVIAGGGASTAATTSTATRLRGTVFDSTLGIPLRGAIVTIEGLGRTTETDSLGRFAFDSLADEGEVRVRAWHARFDSLGFDDPIVTVRLRRRQESTATLALAGLREVTRQRCTSAPPPVERVILGDVRSSADSTKPAAAAEVILLERRGATAGGRDSLVRHTGFTSDGGRYAFCNVKPGSQAWLVTHETQSWSDPRHVRGDSVPVEIVHLQMPVTDSVVAEGGPNGAPLVVLGRTLAPDRSSRISGWVLAPENVSTLVQVLVDDVVRDTVSPDGAFAVDNVSAGARRLTFRGSSVAIRHVGLNVQVGQSHLLLVTLRTGPLVVVERSATAFDARLADFRRRRRVGGGYFLDREDIDKRRPRTLTDIMRTVPGVRVQSEGTGYRYLSAHFKRMPQAGTGMVDDGTCDMMIYLDGQVLLVESGHADSRILVNEIAAMEVYVSAASVPRQFAGERSACGVIVVWRGRG